MSDCPLPHDADVVTLAHGAGGRTMARWLAERLAPRLGSDALRHDAAVLPGRIAVTTDASVVSPLFFPGGDIGRLAVIGAVNDLAVTGAVPEALTLALVLEEGLSLATLDRVLDSIADEARACGVRVVSGDTKVVERGHGDGVYAVTTGIGRVPEGVEVGPWRVAPGDVVLVSGDVGRHGLAVLAARGGLGFLDPLPSDLAPLHGTTAALREAGVDAHCLRDCTRGGLSAVLAEIAAAGGHDLVVEEGAVPVAGPVRAACEVLGLDPWQLACEGRLAAFVAADQADLALAVLRERRPEAARIGVVADGRGRVWLRDAFGGERELDRPAGAALPRIC